MVRLRSQGSGGFRTHHDVGGDHVGVVAHRLDEENLARTRKTERGLNSPPLQTKLTAATTQTHTLKSLSAPNLRIISRLSLVVLVASKTWNGRTHSVTNVPAEDSEQGRGGRGFPDYK